MASQCIKEIEIGTGPFKGLHKADDKPIPSDWPARTFPDYFEIVPFEAKPAQVKNDSMAGGETDNVTIE